MAESVDTCYNLDVRCDSTVCTVSTATAFTNWFCKDCMVPKCCRDYSIFYSSRNWQTELFSDF